MEPIREKTEPQAGSWREIGPTNPFVPFPDEGLESSLPACFHRTAAEHADRIAVGWEEGSLTYRELNRAANRVAHAVLSRDIEGPEPVALLLEHGPQTIVGIFGALKAGKGYTALDLSNPPERARYVLADSGAKILLVSGATRAQAEALAPDGVTLLDINHLPSERDDENPDANVATSDMAMLYYTSGSTGAPKGVIRTHAMVLHTVWRISRFYHAGVEDRFALAASFSFAQSCRNLFVPLLTGGTVYPYDLKRRGIAPMADWLRRNEITILHIVPGVFRQFARTLESENLFPSLRLLVLGGDTIRHGDVELYRKHLSDDCLLRLGMGFTEGGGSGTCMFTDKQTQLPDGPLPIGYAAEGAEITIRDETGRALPPGETGEIVVRSRYLSPGYWRRPDLTERAFEEHPSGDGTRIYRTGDLGRMNPDGCIFHVGRRDSQVKVRGHRVEIGEVQRALLKLDPVRDAVVVARKDRHDRPRLVAYVVAADSACTVTALRDALMEILPQYMLPSAFIFLDNLPTLPSGKVDRSALPEPSTDRPKLATPYLAPRDRMEERLTAIWGEVLNVNRPGVRDNFFDLGGDSLVAVSLLTRVEAQFGVKLPMHALLRAPTIETLAAVIDIAPKPERPSCLVEVQPGRGGTPLFWVPGVGLDVLTLRPLARALGTDLPLYGMQALGFDGTTPPHESVGDMADAYIQEMRDMQPDGPYLLGGACFGGFVAYEMACRLREQGHEVGLLALIDSSQPPPPITLGAYVKSLVAYHLPRGQFFYCLRCDLREVTKKLYRVFSPSPGHRRLRNLRLAHRRARRTWAPRPYPGKIVLFQSREFSTRFPEYKDRWASLVQGGVELVEMPRDHQGALRDERVTRIASELRARIDHVRPIA